MGIEGGSAGFGRGCKRSQRMRSAESQRVGVRNGSTHGLQGW